MTGRRLVHDFGHGRLPGEIIFVPASLGAPEDEGWLMGLVVNVAKEALVQIVDACGKFPAAAFCGQLPSTASQTRGAARP